MLAARRTASVPSVRRTASSVPEFAKAHWCSFKLAPTLVPLRVARWLPVARHRAYYWGNFPISVTLRTDTLIITVNRGGGTRGRLIQS